MTATFEMKYRRSNNDWEGLPFQANGASIAIYITAVTTLVSTGVMKAHGAAIVPCAIYFAGLISAYVVHFTNRLLEGDVDLRERANDAMQWLVVHDSRPDLPAEIRRQIPIVEKLITDARRKTLSVEGIQKLQLRATRYYVWSLACFLLSTAAIFGYFTYFLVVTSSL